ncbi:HlyD family efflux transporter periplasmic adaptor subunit [Cyanobium sp. Morenito 9A2]|uniref:HlyD family efflux transporter periplasmic adaptor subunit n=1 Tax=Cyanobium sp. Morenito 9A2 TaxID=2823718 RepID=UPI0020CC3E23|nr:HlyD family efflux transporter periplasmic adaptor subunit [Cyanobium sp. Morenito 9A2]MCP9850520.1 HlyD family efflux transporter periplasmic adaptor subunit [Cyanobium sp. Morenito 9A2]
MTNAQGRWWIGGGVALLALLVFGFWRAQHKPQPALAPSAAQQRSAAAERQAREAVSALGRLEPAGDVRKLAAPITGFGGSPRISELFVEEGQSVTAGQLLARFDNAPSLLADRLVLRTRITSLSARYAVLERETKRYRQLALGGATSTDDLEARELKLIELKGQLDEARASLVKVQADLLNTVLRAPIDGTVLRLSSRVGERPGDNGILELGASERMEAVAEVYESDIDRVRLGQKVRLTSENGGFAGTLIGTVARISPQVRQRVVVSTDPTGDADARVVEVRIQLDPADVAKVRQLTGLKTINRFEP